MEKLIELLNSFEAKLEEMPLARKKWKEENWILYRRFMNVEDAERMVISKSFWFIKRLVENNMIDMRKVKKWEIMIWCDDVDNTIIKLSISDNPIEDLISYLK